MEQVKINLITKDNVCYHKLGDGQIFIDFKIYPINNIITNLATADDLMSLMIVADKIKKANCVINTIFVPYLTAQNLSAIAPIINSINYRTIYINDPIWQVPFEINRCCLENALSHLNYGNKNIAIMYLNKLSQSQYAIDDNSYVYEPNIEVKEKTIRIIHRSCFDPNKLIDIAREFKAQEKKIEIAVSYVITGLNSLLEEFDKVYTTDVFLNYNLEYSDKLEIFKLRS